MLGEVQLMVDFARIQTELAARPLLRLGTSARTLALAAQGLHTTSMLSGIDYVLAAPYASDRSAWLGFVRGADADARAPLAPMDLGIDLEVGDNRLRVLRAMAPALGADNGGLFLWCRITDTHWDLYDAREWARALTTLPVIINGPIAAFVSPTHTAMVPEGAFVVPALAHLPEQGFDRLRRDLYALVCCARYVLRDGWSRETAGKFD